MTDPTIPVIQVTGTNGKTTTVRLLAHLVRTAGRSVAFSSTDGVYRDDGELVERGDYSGFGGAAMALAQEPDIAVLETARGGMLLRGAGVLHNDVAVVTNVSADHLGLHGVDTVDQLAEVKGIITRITRPDGWDVLNADDPRVLAMRRNATGRPWLFSTHPDHPALREALREGGRAMSIQDGRLTWFSDHRAHPMVAMLDVPMTLAGVSRINAQNAMAAAAAALAIGLPHRAVVKGLKTFVQDPEHNPGRANLFSIDGTVVMIDYAHNEAGMSGLVETLDGLRPRGGHVWLAICTAGDRTNEILRVVRVPGRGGFGPPGGRRAPAVPPWALARGHHRATRRTARRQRASTRSPSTPMNSPRCARWWARPAPAMSWASPPWGCARRSSPGSKTPEPRG